MHFDRVWAMPHPETFRIQPIEEFVLKYYRDICVDPFARNSKLGRYRNDLDPSTEATYHMEAREFLAHLRAQGVQADCVICDPPYSQVQVSRSYQGVGLEYKPFGDDNNAVLYREVRNGLDELLVPGGIALSFGWNSSGFGKKRGYEILELKLICHGGAHNDTICMAERKLQAGLFTGRHAETEFSGQSDPEGFKPK